MRQWHRRECRPYKRDRNIFKIRAAKTGLLDETTAKYMYLFAMVLSILIWISLMLKLWSDCFDFSCVEASRFLYLGG